MNTDLDAALERILPRVSKPARYTGGELNSIVKNHLACDVRFAIAFPDAYEIGMSNLALSILYHLLNSRADCLAERTYAPWPDMERELRASGLPLFTLETRRPVADFDFFAVSLSYELGYTNLLNMLDLAGIPLRSADRDTPPCGSQAGGRAGAGAARWPLVIAGGHCTYNPEPMAPFVDVFVIGEGEEVLAEIIETYKELRDAPREELLLALANVRGCYVPRFYDSVYGDTVRDYVPPDARFAHADTRAFQAVVPRDEYAGRVPERIERRVVWDMDNVPYPTRPVIPFIEVVHDRISLEVMRGCTRGCRFCQAGMITRPVRERSPERLMQLAEELIENTGHEDVSLVSLSTADYSRVGEVVHRMIEAHGERKVGVSLPSLRADLRCMEVVKEISKVRKTGLTFAPEAGTQRLRDVTNKGVTEEDLFAAVETAFANGWQRVKLYFMISLPTETDEDVIGIADLATRVAKLARRLRVKNPTVAIGVSTFVPKPHTPWQWHGQDLVAEVERKQTLLRKHLGDRAVQFRYHNPRSSHLEAVLSLGDRRVAEAIEGAWRKGAKFDSWDEFFDYETWMEAFATAGVDPHFFANRHKSHDMPLPWDHIDCGVTKSYLRLEDRRSREGRLTHDCHTAPCTMCQACDRFVLDGVGLRQARKGGGSSGLPVQ